MDNQITNYKETSHKIRYLWEAMKAFYAKIVELNNRLFKLEDATKKNNAFIAKLDNTLITQREIIYEWNVNIPVEIFVTITGSSYEKTINLDLPENQNCIFISEVSLGKIYNDFPDDILYKKLPNGFSGGHAPGWFQERYLIDNNELTFKFTFFIQQDDGFYIGKNITAQVRIWKISSGENTIGGTGVIN